MKKLFFIAIVMSLFSCEHLPPTENDQYYDGVVKVWYDEDGRRHRTYKSNHTYSHIVDGKVVAYIDIPDTLTYNLDSLIEANNLDSLIALTVDIDSLIEANNLDF